MSGLEIFKAGTHTDMAGKAHTFTAGDVAATVAAYDPALFAAPLGVCTPQVEDPAYGWVAGLSLAADIVQADPEKVEPAFVAPLKESCFTRITPSFLRPTAPTNPQTHSAS